MATSKKDAGQAEAQALADDAAAKGHIGHKPSGSDNRAHTLLSGPDSPSASEQRAASLEARAQTIRDQKEG